MESSKHSDVVHLNWSNVAGSVTVTPRDEDRYNLKIHEAVERLEIGGKVARLQAELSVLYNRLVQWLGTQDSLREAFLTLRDGGLIFVVVRDSPKYDEDFEDSLTDLDIAIANDRALSRIRLDVLSLPDASEESLETFVNEGFLISFRRVEEPNAV